MHGDRVPADRGFARRRQQPGRARSTARIDRCAAVGWDDRAVELVPHETAETSFSASWLFAAAHPEAVKIVALSGFLRWRRLAMSGPRDNNSSRRRSAAASANPATGP